MEPDQINTLAAYLTAQNGDGLTSPSVDVTTLHDAAAPSVVLGAPAAGFVRGVVNVAGHVSDTGSGVATVALTADGVTLTTTLAPPVPGASTSLTARWDTGATADGAREIVVLAGDRAGNTSAARRTVLVDNTAPETTIVSEPSGDVAVTMVSVIVAGTDALTPASQLEFAWRLDEGPWSPFSPATRIDLVALAAGVHRFEVKARDLAGNEDPTPAWCDFAVRSASLHVSIAHPVAGAAISSGVLLVRGIVTAGGQIVVNGMPALVSGSSFAVIVDVDESVTSVNAVASLGGATAQASIPITVMPGGPSTPYLVASPVMGIAPLTVTFSMVGAPADATLTVDADSDGVTDASGAAGASVSYTYSAPGLYVVSATAAGFTAPAVVNVLDAAALDAALQATWTAMKDALRAGDVARATGHISSETRGDYGMAFGLIARLLPGIDAILTDIALVEVRGASALYEMLRTDDGLLRSFEVRFTIDTDGAWRLESF